MMGLLDGLNDPEFMALYYARRALIDHIAKWGHTTPEVAREWLDAHDEEAMQIFAEGSKLSKPMLH